MSGGTDEAPNGRTANGAGAGGGGAGRGTGRGRGTDREAEVRRLLDGRHPAVPAGLAAGAAARGIRLLRRRRILRRLAWTLLFAAVVAFAVWAALVQPWEVPPSRIAPPLEGW
ncbi:hypothetical protein [Streptomyces sp. NPDC090022]|uniref:hypothetical protein n=1 Tax=Streptomyces sp. NPDC090022 TaxID=3365920 RepID=UPI00381FD2D6